MKESLLKRFLRTGALMGSCILLWATLRTCGMPFNTTLLIVGPLTIAAYVTLELKSYRA